ncbi:MAG: family 16 glycosylhydrolase [Pseudomonadota bacterium]
MFRYRSAVAFTAIVIAGLLSSTFVLAKPYKGAEVYSSETHKYGRYVTRMQVAKGSGVLSTFFTYKEGSEQAGAFWEEIDVEVFGKNDAIEWQSNIIQGQPKKLTEDVHNASQSLGDAYHTYTVDWTPTYVAWFLDGVEVRRITGGEFVTSLTSEQGMRFNLWASTSESWVGAFSDAILPVHQFINYFEYYSYDTTTEAFTLLWRDDFDSLSSTRWGLANWTFAENRVDFAPENAVIKDGVLVLALTHESATGFTGSVPVDNGSASSAATVSSSSAAVASSIASSIASSKASSAASSVSAPVKKSSKGGGSASFEFLAMLLLFAFYQRQRN